MLRRPYSFPPLNSLIAFESAARHLSLTRAGVELNVTTGAISKHIKTLESDIGHALFMRLHRAMALTTEGEVLFNTLRTAFEDVSSTFKQLKTSGEAAGVSIGTTTAVAQLWLMPKLRMFWSAHQEIVIDHIISDRPQELFRPDVDLRIRYGGGVWPGEDSARMFDDRIFAVASRAFLRTHKVKSATDLADLSLLSVEAQDPTWTSWSTFLRDVGVPYSKLKVRRFSSYVVALQAAQNGQGIALGWARLVRPLLKTRELVQVTSAEIVAPHSYYVTWNKRKRLNRQAETLRDWLLTSDD